MRNTYDPMSLHRRDFLRWLAASPLLPYLSGCDFLGPPEALAQEAPARALQELAATAAQALDIFGMDFLTPGMTWDFIARLRDLTDQRMIVKGLVTYEDAELAVQHGVDAVWVSNHGGRSEGSGRATIDALPEMADAIQGPVPIIVDGGFRRGMDILKAIARGATAVAIGRPHVWGLGAFGQEGVERVLAILRNELRITMGIAGTPSLADIGPRSIGTG